MAELENLKQYLSEAEPLVNKELRTGFSGNTFDGLFEEGEVPEFLYRLLPNEYVEIDNQSIYCDAAYLSCTKSADYFLSHVSGGHIACLKIKLTSPINRIVVNELVADANDEGEYILPRNMKLYCKCNQTFSGIVQLEQFAEQEDLYVSGKELELIGIHSITLYELYN